MVGNDVTTCVLDFLNNAHFSYGPNDVNIVLIPNKQNPKSVANLQPIALCNVTYKIMEKKSCQLNGKFDRCYYLIFVEYYHIW